MLDRRKFLRALGLSPLLLLLSKVRAKPASTPSMLLPIDGAEYDKRICNTVPGGAYSVELDRMQQIIHENTATPPGTWQKYVVQEGDCERTFWSYKNITFEVRPKNSG